MDVNVLSIYLVQCSLFLLTFLSPCLSLSVSLVHAEDGKMSSLYFKDEAEDGKTSSLYFCTLNSGQH